MTDIPDSSTTILRQDAEGRVQTPPEIRERILDEFETSGLSAPKFAKLHGINYQTFAGWRKRRKDRLANEDQSPASNAENNFTFLEVTSEQSVIRQEAANTLVVELAGGHKVGISNQSQIAPLADLIETLNRKSSHNRSC